MGIARRLASQSVATTAVFLALSTPCWAANPIYTLVGNGPLGHLGEGGPATAAGVETDAAVAALPDGGYLIGEEGRVRTVDTAGRIRTVAGNGRAGFSGDGGLAVHARVAPSELAALPGGGFLIAECGNHRIRRVDRDGRITTVAGSGRDAPPGSGDDPVTAEEIGDGGPAREAILGCPNSVAVAPDGAIIIGDSARVRRIAPDGTIRTVAGNGESVVERLNDGRLATRVALSPDSVSVTPSGAILIADGFNSFVRRVGTDGRISTVAGTGENRRRRDDGRYAVFSPITPVAVEALPGGGFLVADNGLSRATGDQPRIRVVGPDRRIRTIAGTGRFVPDPPRGLERRGDGAPALRADLYRVSDVATLTDGGVIVAEGLESFGGGRRPHQGRIRYVSPESPGMFAAALRRDRHRRFTRGSRPSVAVALTAPASVELVVTEDGRRHSLTRSLPAGTSRLELPAVLSPEPHRVRLTATSGAARVAMDAYTISPRGWLETNLARYVAEGIVFEASNFPYISGTGVLGCRRFGERRVDCRLSQEGRRCDVVASILLNGRRLHWGTYRCPARVEHKWRRRPRPLLARHFSCEGSDTDCTPPGLFRKLTPAILAPTD